MNSVAKVLLHPGIHHLYKIYCGLFLTQPPNLSPWVNKNTLILIFKRKPSRKLGSLAHPPISPVVNVLPACKSVHSMSLVNLINMRYY